MTTDPGDVVLDPTCGSGTTAYCAEKLGRRWMTCDTSRVAINVARQRLISGTFEHYQTRNGKVSGNFLYKTVERVTLRSLAYDLEPEKVELVDQPEVDRDAIRVCGPFEVMSLGRYSVEDWKGYVVREPRHRRAGEARELHRGDLPPLPQGRGDPGCDRPRPRGGGDREGEDRDLGRAALGRVTAKQINDAVQDALASGILEVHVLGWAFEANVGEVKSALEKRGKVKVELIMIRPDTLAEGLKATQPEMLFSPLALPDIEVAAAKNGKEKQLRVTLNGVALFDRKRRTHRVQGGRLGLRLGLVPRRGLRRRLLRGLPDVLRLQEEAEHQGRAQGRGGPRGVHAQARLGALPDGCAATSASR
jgi:adenine-specific DNA-methyltransferase